MPNQKKIDTVAELRDQIERSAISIAADYRGLTVTEMVQLRRAIREAGVQMRRPAIHAAGGSDHDTSDKPRNQLLFDRSFAQAPVS